tara:strand:- start:447 stop:812 length:366 start_codon:yes stop_codon:yes gene_type:complete
MQSNKMSNKLNINPFDFQLKDDITPNDLMRIQIIQNHTIIQLLSYQTTSPIQTAFNNTAWDKYKSEIKPYINKEKVLLKDPSNLKAEYKIQYDNLKKRYDAGEDISNAVKDLGFEDYFELE